MSIERIKSFFYTPMDAAIFLSWGALLVVGYMRFHEASHHIVWCVARLMFAQALLALGFICLRGWWLKK